MQPFFNDQTDTVIFDIGEVLVDYGWREYLAAFGFEQEVFETIADAVFLNEDWEEGDRGGVTTQEWLSLLIDNAPGYEAQIRQVFARMGETIVPRPITEEWIQYFKDRNFSVYYLSNYSQEMYRQSKEKLSFLRLFDGGIFSWKEKCIKPQEEIYRLLLERYDICPERTVFFDDRLINVKAARRLNIQGVVFTPDIPLQILGK